MLFMTFKHIFFLFALMAVVFNPAAKIIECKEKQPLNSVEENSEIINEDVEDRDDGVKEYKFGTWSYYSTQPVTLETHLKNIEKIMGRDISFLFENEWRNQTKKEKLRQLSSDDNEYNNIDSEISEEFKELLRLSNCHYQSARINIFEYVDPCQIPKDLAWRFGTLLFLYGNFQKEMDNQKIFLDEKILVFYKTSYLYFSYYLNLSESVPAILQQNDLNSIVCNPEFYSELDRLFHKELFTFDELLWIQAIQKLDQQRLHDICTFFRSFYRFILENRESFSDAYLSLASSLIKVTTEIMLSSQKRADYNLDAINPWMFKLYNDIKKCEKLEMKDKVYPNPDTGTLFLEVKNQCLKLLPDSHALKDITEENEFIICEKVRMRNLLPSIQKDLSTGEKIIDEFEFSPLAMRKAFIGLLNFFDDRARFLRGDYIAVKDSDEKIQQIYNYLSGYIDIDELPINKDNALDYLLEIKLFDLLADVWNSHYHVDYEYYGGMHFGYIGFDQFYFLRTTYELRKKILKICPGLKSYEALTISVNPDAIREEKDNVTSGAWMDEFEILRQDCIEDLLKKAQYLSAMMEQSSLKSIIVGTRGVSAAGKTSFIKKNLLPLILNGNNDLKCIEILAQGILNPDILKAAIKKLQGGTLNTQVHDEGASAFQQLFKEIAERESYILDKRHLTPHEIITNLVEPARKGGRSVWLYDFDISLTTSLIRILTRPLHGEDPCPDFEALVNGFISARRYRAQVASLAMQEKAITKYELYATSQQCLVAEKNRENCSFKQDCEEFLSIYDPQLFEECLKEPTYQEIEKDFSQIIDDSFITEAISRGDICYEQCETLEKWKGMTLKEAIKLHVQGEKSNFDENLFESPEIFPFEGSKWLAEFPQLIAYLKREHLLHNRGVDETGNGLHWEAGYFENGMNSQYAPDAKAPGYSQGGIQMKLGYFIVPMDNLELHLSKNLSPSIAREITVRNEKGDLIGLRFFIHPTAYAHFAPLLLANIPFVPPSQSDFMGSPIASYNSWLVRRVSSHDRKPFIVKMGTPNGQSDIKHLLPGDNIIKSLSIQKHLDNLPDKKDLIFFKETMGIILKYIQGYPAGTVDSGIIISEVLEELLNGECQILSLSAAMSCEKLKTENHNLAIGQKKEIESLPLIFELMETSIQNGVVKTPFEFLKTYFIDAYLKAIESISFKDGYSFKVDGENLYLLINQDHTIKGFAYRDLEKLSWKKNFLESYSWNYRYANFIKLLNVLTHFYNDDIPAPLGAPIRSGIEKTTPERNLYNYLCKRLEKQGNYNSLEFLKRFSITPEEHAQLLRELDSSYLFLLSRYFALDKANVLNSDGTVPCAEKGSAAAKGLIKLNEILWENRIFEEEKVQSN